MFKIAYYEGEKGEEKHYRDDYPNLELNFEDMNLTNEQKSSLQNISEIDEETLCQINNWKVKPPTQGLYCEGVWDTVLCWPPTPANVTVNQTRLVFYDDMIRELIAHRTCNESGQWHTNKTKFDLFDHMNKTKDDVNDHDPDEQRMALILSQIYFFGSIVSCVMLLITLFIFCYFKSLHCARIRIHRNLVLSFILRSLLYVIVVEPFVTGHHWSRQVDWFCKLVQTLVYYSTIANTAWMFVEGLFLHNSVAVSVFDSKMPFKLYYLIGWGIPVPTVISWTVCMSLYNHNDCWQGAFLNAYAWIITAPILIFLSINLLFLINIIRIVITKLRADQNTVEVNNFRKAVRATAVLFPLLGLTNVLVCIEPNSGYVSRMIYRIANAVLQSSQGMFVSIIYCFLNAEVKSAIRRKWSGQTRIRRRSSVAKTTIFTSTSNINFRRGMTEMASYSVCKQTNDSPDGIEVINKGTIEL